jgi:hypothetical protein
MKTPDSRREFHTPSRHYHRHRIQDPDPWDTWLGLEKKARRGARRGRKIAVWTFGVAGFLAVVGLVCYELL